MPNPLNHKQKAFALAFATGDAKGNKTKAAIAAGYSPRTAADAGCRLSTNPEIVALVEKHQANIVEKAEVKGAAVLTELANFAHSDILGAFNDDGTLKHPKDMTPELRRAIKSIEFTELFEGASGEKFVTGRIVKISLWDKPAGLKMLGDNVGLFKSVAEKKIEESLADLLAQARAPESAE